MIKSTDAVLIYDGECRFCSACLAWLRKRLQITALAFQSADLQRYGLTRDQCEESVFVDSQGDAYSGATAISFLLRLRGNTFLSSLISKSGRFGEIVYRQIASHRDSLIIRLVTRYLELLVARTR